MTLSYGSPEECAIAQRHSPAEFGSDELPGVEVDHGTWDDAPMPRDARTIVKYVVAGLALAAMLVLAPSSSLPA